MNEEISTIYLTGLPSDVTTRELKALFRFAPGFEAAAVVNENDDLAQSLLSSSAYFGAGGVSGGCYAQFGRNCFSGLLDAFIRESDTLSLPEKTTAETVKQIGFARFACRQDAIDARSHLHSKPFDPDGASTDLLKVEFAKRNLPLLVLSSSVGMGMSSESSSFVEVPVRSFSSQPSLLLNVPPSAMLSTAAATNAAYYTPPAVQNPYSIRACPPLLSPYASRRASSGSQHLLQMHNNCMLLCENPPCNTLYVGNLPVNASEDELRALFADVSGFKRMSFRSKPPNGPMCFVEFEDVAAATQAMTSLYGTPLSCSTKGGIRLSYSKNPLGVRSNAAPNSINVLGGGLKSLEDTTNAHVYIYHPMPIPNTNSNVSYSTPTAALSNNSIAARMASTSLSAGNGFSDTVASL